MGTKGEKMLRSIMMISLAGLMSLPSLSQTGDRAAEKQSAAPQTGESASKRFYQLSFVVQELDNERVINSRTYTMIIKERGSIRAGEKVPFTSARGVNSTQ